VFVRNRNAWPVIEKKLREHFGQKQMNWGNAFVSEYYHFIVVLVAIFYFMFLQGAIVLKMLKNE